MKVAYFSHYYSNIKSGPGRFSEQLRNFPSNDIKFTFFSDSIKYPNANEVKIPVISFLKLLPGYWIVRSFLFYKAFSKSTIPFQLVICSNAFEGFFLTIIAKRPIVVMVNDNNYIYSKQNFRKVNNLYSIRTTLSRFIGFYIERIIVKKSDKIIACSQFLKEEIIKYYQIPEHKIKVIYPGVDLNSFYPSNENRKKFLNEEVKILFAKNDWRRGGLDIIIEALSKYNGTRKIHLDIAGTESYEKQNILALASKFNFDSFEITGPQTREEVHKKIILADILVLCSRLEAFGILLLESLACKTPVIATNIGGIPEVLDNGKAGFLISPESPQELTTLLNYLVENPEKIEAKTEYGLNHVKKFSTNILYSNLESLLLSFKGCNK